MNEINCVLSIKREKRLCFKFSEYDIEIMESNIIQFIVMMFNPRILLTFRCTSFVFKTTSEIKNSLRFIIPLLEESSHNCLKISLN